MEPEITVYDDKNNQIGKTFARRAKQLVGKGRAIWTDDNRRAVILADGTDVSEVYAPNGGVPTVDLREEAETVGPSDDLLLHLAKERVRRKKAMKWHIGGIISAALFIFVFFLAATEGFWRVPPIGWIMFGFCYGMIAVWGIWIGCQIAASLRDRPLRPNEVEREFRRLKSMQVK
ncbi:MAG: hypothetical protein LBE55_00685 [Clostridiales bacterium]|jgi:hypothetical protein|nr:hypothetical protein [Clostridiales bacterium]